MSDSFTLNFLYKGVPQEINCVLRVSRFNYQLLCEIENRELLVEKDDEGNWRVIKADPFSNDHAKTDAGFVRALILEIENVLR